MEREDHLEAAFHRLDADSNGTISIDELKRVLPARSRQEVEQALTQFDANGDGMLDLGEFKFALRSLTTGLGVYTLSTVTRRQGVCVVSSQPGCAVF